MRQAAIEATGQFCVAYHKQGSPSSTEAFDKTITNLVPKLCDLVSTDEEAAVVCIALEELVHLLKECGQAVTRHQGHPELIVKSVHQVMKGECHCMDSGEENDDNNDVGDDTEQDEALFEYAGEVVPALGRAMTPVSFAPYFAGLLMHLLKKSRQQCTEAERSFAAGTLADCMEPLAGAEILQPFVPKLAETFVKMSTDESEDVRNNAVFGLGELALHAGAAVRQHLPAFLEHLCGLLRRGEEAGRVLDQVVGSLCRLLVADRTALGMAPAEIMSVVLANLPLKEDKEEYHVRPS